MNELSRASSLRPEKLDARCYLQSLAGQALRLGLMTDGQFQSLQESLLTLLAAQTDKFNRGRSSSIRLEQAQELLASLLFVLGLRLKAEESPEKALETLQNVPVSVLYEDGIALVRRRLSLCRLMQQRILSGLFRTPNRFYRLTIEEGVNGFFRLYRPQFSAHEIHITADYPPLLGRPALDGVEFIEQYLRSVEAENAILRQFDPDDVHRVLLSLSREYADSPINLLEYPLLAALGLGLLGRNPWRLRLSADDVNRLAALLSPLDVSAIRAQLVQALEALRERLPVHAFSYAQKCLPRLASHIHTAARASMLERTFLTPAGVESEAELLLNYGERMTDAEYQRLLDALRPVQGEARVRLTLAGVHSLADFIDLLSDLSWREEDLNLLVRSLPYADFLALTHLYPDCTALERPAERMLHQALFARRAALSPAERRRFDAALARIRESD